MHDKVDPVHRVSKIVPPFRSKAFDVAKNEKSIQNDDDYSDRRNLLVAEVNVCQYIQDVVDQRLDETDSPQ